MLSWDQSRLTEDLERIVRDIDSSEMLFAGLRSAQDRSRVDRRLVALHIELLVVLDELDATDDPSLIERRARTLARSFRERASIAFDRRTTLGFATAS
jgi:hypothetical protein